MKKDYKNDPILVTAIAGTIGSAARALIPLVFYFLKLYKEPAFVAVTKFMLKTKDVSIDFANFGQLFLGFLVFVAFGALLVIILTFTYIKFGTDFYLIKGAFFGIAVWVIVRTFIMGLIIKEGTSDLSTHYISLASHIIYGMLSGYFIIRLERFIKEYQSH